jgi:hypothetical protein
MSKCPNLGRESSVCPRIGHDAAQYKMDIYLGLANSLKSKDASKAGTALAIKIIGFGYLSDYFSFAQMSKLKAKET